jgi:hypothetical protein
MIDENAYGLLISYYDIEEDEYGLERDAFVQRFETFRNAVVECLRELRLGHDVRAVDMGHAIYVEVADGDEETGPIAWLRDVRALLTGNGIASVAVLTHGSRWVNPESRATFETEWVIGDIGLLTVSRASEAMRRALYADAASRADDENYTVGWGPGLYLDTEAVEALGVKPKNEPTVLRSSGVAFYRAGS